MTSPNDIRCTNRWTKNPCTLEMHSLPLVCNQVEHSLRNRKIETNGILDTAAQVALNRLISMHGEAIVVIPGAAKVSLAEDAGNTKKFKLSGEDIDEWIGLRGRIVSVELTLCDQN